MAQRSPHEITRLLVAWSTGDEAALAQLMPLVYDELRRLARRYMHGERPGHTLQTTALVNEAYLRLVNWRDVQWQNRAHFFAVSAQLMRRILVDFAREKLYLKRGGGAPRVSLSEASHLAAGRDADLVELDEALTALASMDSRKSQVVEMRFFGGLTNREVAEVLKVSEETVMRDWRLAKVWLLSELGKKRLEP
ncbi:MAG TPA: sigma-70 family RNA polymerase sigma factor [Thermoanaerobaculia bacterium]|nr:sigma-70 family RNA polymerase sigma factor [Thermoanaerobaculia bacterium]